MQRTIKGLIRLCGCAGGSAPLLLAYGINRFCHNVAHWLIVSKAVWYFKRDEFVSEVSHYCLQCFESFNEIFRYFGGASLRVCNWENKYFWCISNFYVHITKKIKSRSTTKSTKWRVSKIKSRSTTKSTKWHVCLANTQISLGIHPVWSESWLSTYRDIGTWLPIECTEKTLIRLCGCPGWTVFARRICPFVGFVMLLLNYFEINPITDTERGVWSRSSLLDLNTGISVINN